jgi:hypothetical protein
VGRGFDSLRWLQGVVCLNLGNICNKAFLVLADLKVERFPSGQREQTVNLPAQPSEVRILPSPPPGAIPCKFYKADPRGRWKGLSCK